jgi:succinate dehydrogenase / fumarate reductase flavoprotein subunit
MRFNTDILEAWELGCLLDLAEVTTLSGDEPHRRAAARTGAKTSPKRDDVNWLKHTFVTCATASSEHQPLPVTITEVRAAGTEILGR